MLKQTCVCKTIGELFTIPNKSGPLVNKRWSDAPRHSHVSVKGSYMGGHLSGWPAGFQFRQYPLACDYLSRWRMG